MALLGSEKRRRWLLAMPCVLALAGGLLWYFSDPQRRIERWLEGLIRQAYRDAAGPNAPLDLKEVRVRTELGELAQGRIPELRLLFVGRGAQPPRIEIGGPLEINQNLLSLDLNTDVDVVYAPKVRLKLPPGSPIALPEFELGIRARVAPASGKLKQLFIEPSLSRFEGRALQLTLDEPTLKVDFDQNMLKTEFGAKGLAWQPSDSRAVNLTGISGTLKLPLSLDPLVIGPDVELKAQAAGTEILWDDLYAELPLRDFGFTLTSRLDLSPAHKDLPVEWMVLRIGNPERPGLQLKTSVRRDRRGLTASAVEAELETRKFPLTALWSWFLKSVQPGQFEGLDRLRETLKVHKGTASVRARAVVPLPDPFALEGWSMRSELRVDGAHLATADRTAAVAGLNLRLPLDLRIPTTGSLSARFLRFRKLTGSLEPVRFDLSPYPVPGPGEDPMLEVDVPDGVQFRFAEIPWNTGPLWGRVLRTRDDEEGFNYWFGTSLEAGPVSVKRLSPALCIADKDSPEANLTARFPQVTLSRAGLVLDGAAELHLFEGKIRMTGIRVFRPFSPVPETQFTARWDGIRLDEIGRWTRFGEMQGVLKGYAKDVVFQSWLPTQYEFKADLKPYQSRKVVFSAKAVNNVARVLSGEDPSKKLPGIARFFAFDLPEILSPGFSLEWAGITVVSRDGWILVEDHTPPERVEKDGRRYFMFGTRVKVPFIARQYPVVLDAHAMAEYTRRMATYFLSIRKEEEEPQEQGDSTNDEHQPCLPDPLPES